MRASTAASASATSRDLPTPASPTTVSSSQRASACARPHASTDLGELPLATHEPRLVAALRRVQYREEPVRRHRLRLPLQRQRLHRVGKHRLVHERVGRLADQHLTGLCRLLQPRRDVHRIPGREPLLRSRHDLAGVDTDPAVEPELRQRIAHLHRRTTRPQRVILVQHRHAKHRHHRIADELLHRPAVPLDDPLHPLEVAREHLPQRLRIRRLPQRRRPHQVTEHHRHRLAQPTRRRNLDRRRPHSGQNLNSTSA